MAATVRPQSQATVTDRGEEGLSGAGLRALQPVAHAENLHRFLGRDQRSGSGKLKDWTIRDKEVGSVDGQAGGDAKEDLHATHGHSFMWAPLAPKRNQCLGHGLVPAAKAAGAGASKAPAVISLGCRDYVPQTSS